MSRPPPSRRAFGAGPSILRWTLVVAAAAVLVLVPEVVFLTFGGALFACGLSAPASWIARHTPLSKAWAVGLTCLLLAAISGGLTALVGADLTEQLRALTAEAPRIWEDLEAALRQSPIGGLLPDLPPPGPLAADAAEQAMKLLAGLASALGAGLVLAFLAFYLAAQPALYRRAAIQLLPPPARERARRVLEELGDVLASWLLGRLAGMLVVGVLLAAGLATLGVPLPLALGLIAALLDFVPNVGPIVAALPALLLVAPAGPEQLLAVAGLYLGVQLLEAYVLTPLIDKRTASVPPAVVIVAQLAFGLLFGALGLAFATPVVAAGMVLVRQLWLEDTLGEPSEPG